MQLGQLIAHLESEADAAEAMAALGDLALFAEVAAMGEAHGESPGEYVALGAARFASLAGDEAWLQLVSAMERAADPGRAVLTRIVRWAIDRDRHAATAHEPAHAAGETG